MINKNYIERGKKIRKEFIQTSQKLELILNKLKSVSEKLKEYHKDLKDLSESEKNPEEIKRLTLQKLTLIEKEGIKLNKEYKPLNDKMENLKKEESILYKNVKEKYPELTDEEIKNEFQKGLTS